MSYEPVLDEWVSEWYHEPLTDEQEEMAIARMDMSDEEFDEWYNKLINE